MAWGISLNLGRKRTAAFRRKTLRRVRWSLKKWQPLMNLQEVDEADSGDEHSWLKRDFPQYKWANFLTHVPIGIGRISWVVGLTDTIFGHKGIAGLTPHRVISKAITWPRWNKLKRLVVYNNHTTRLGAHGGKLELRKQYHAEYIEHLSKDVHEEVDENGESAMIYGDFNTTDEPDIHPRQRVIMRDGYDWIIAVEPLHPRPGKPKVHIEVKEKRVIPMDIDGHDALAVRFGLKLIR